MNGYWHNLKAFRSPFVESGKEEDDCNESLHNCINKYWEHYPSGNLQDKPWLFCQSMVRIGL